MLNKLYCIILLCIFGVSHGSDKGQMSVTVTNNPNYPLVVELKEKDTEVLIKANRDQLANFIISAKKNDRFLKRIEGLPLKEKNQAVFNTVFTSLETIAQNDIPAFHIHKTEPLYPNLLNIFKYFTHYHWTVNPTVFYIPDVPSSLKLEYPENTSVLDLKKLIYQKLSQNSQDSILTSKSYNILVNQNTKALHDNVKMQDIDLLDQTIKNSFSLRLTKSKFDIFYNQNEKKIELAFFNPPCISIDNVPSISSLIVTLNHIIKNNYSTIEITVSQDQNDRVMASITNENFVQEFLDALTKKIRVAEFAFLKKSLSLWAITLNKQVSFQAELLPTIKTTNQPTAANSKSYLQRIKAWLQQKQSAAILFIGGISAFAFGSLVYKNLPSWPNWYQNWMPKGSNTMPNKPTVPAG